MRSAAIIKKEGMEHLIEKLGVIETEVFISSISCDHFDYTEWQREYFEKYSADEFLRDAIDYERTHPFKHK
jgi:hypothetical protein